MEANRHGFIPIAVDMGEGDWLIDFQGVLEKPLDEVDMMGIHGDAVTGKAFGDFGVKVFLVAVIFLAVDADGFAFGDDLVTIEHILSVAVGGWRNDPEDIIDVELSEFGLGRGHDDRRSA